MKEKKVKHLKRKFFLFLGYEVIILYYPAKKMQNRQSSIVWLRRSSTRNQRHKRTLKLMSKAATNKREGNKPLLEHRVTVETIGGEKCKSQKNRGRNHCQKLQKKPN